jgi:ElaB/YqjD/DUF883 family membrane-anchored ribosome-binding protein
MATADPRIIDPVLPSVPLAVDGADLRDQVRVLGQDFKELARLTKTALGQKVEATQGAAHQVFDRGREKAAEYRDHVSHLTREQPIKAILIAAGVGAVLGLILGRR